MNDWSWWTGQLLRTHSIFCLTVKHSNSLKPGTLQAQSLPNSANRLPTNPTSHGVPRDANLSLLWIFHRPRRNVTGMFLKGLSYFSTRDRKLKLYCSIDMWTAGKMLRERMVQCKNEDIYKRWYLDKKRKKINKIPLHRRLTKKKIPD